MQTDTLLECPIKITSAAISEIKRLRESTGIVEGQALRIGVKGGGCSGMSYLLAFDEIKPSDNHYDVEGEKIIMDKSHLMYVIGMQVDFGDGLNARGFTFTNPNAKETCGCGTSFSA
jgi:iron-sulfur cluster assembly protein